MRKPTGGPAYPTTPENEMRMNGQGGEGMTLRDYFAGQILASVTISSGEGDVQWMKQHGAKYIYEIADAMLKAREG